MLQGLLYYHPINPINRRAGYVFPTRKNSQSQKKQYSKNRLWNTNKSEIASQSQIHGSLKVSARFNMIATKAATFPCKERALDQGFAEHVSAGGGGDRPKSPESFCMIPGFCVTGFLAITLCVRRSIYFRYWSAVCNF